MIHAGRIVQKKNMEFTPCFPGNDPAKTISSGWMEVELGMEPASRADPLDQFRLDRGGPRHAGDSLT